MPNQVPAKMHALNRIKKIKLSHIGSALVQCKARRDQLKGNVDIYKQLVAEHAWAMEMVTMFETSYQECENKHGLTAFVELNEKKQVIWITLEEFKLKLEDSASVMMDFLTTLNEDLALLEEIRVKVGNETDIAQLETIDVPRMDWLGFIPDFEFEPFEEINEQWEDMNLLDRIIELLLELRLLVDKVNAADN